jgi:predicted transport protein
MNVKTEIDWTTPRLICVAENYNKFDLDTAEILPIKIELLKYTIYNSNLLYIDKESQPQLNISTSKIFEKGKRTREERAKLQKEYSIDAHLSKTNETIKQLYLSLRERIMGLDDSIVEEPKSKYIAFKLATNFVDVVIQKDSLKIFLNMPSGKLNDPHGFARDLKKPRIVGHWGNGDYEAYIRNQQDAEKAFELIKQSYSYNK